MIWVRRDDGKMSSLSGQEALADAATRHQKLDSSKTFTVPRRRKRQTKDERDLGPPVKLDTRASAQLRSFVQDFLDSGFNPLFQHVRKSIHREAPHVMQYHRRQFFYLVAWFLEAERTRRRASKAAGRPGDSEVGSFNLVAEVLNQEMFITLNMALHRSFEDKDWPELAAVMRCFTQILLTVQEMVESGRDDDEEIAENVLSRLFYEESTQNAIANITRTYKDQGFDYLDAATELVHHFLRILEAFSKQNVDMQVRSRKRARRKKQSADRGGKTEAGEKNDDSANDEDDAKQTSKERKFSFLRFSNQFAHQGVVDTFVTWTKHYRDLSDAQLKRAHRYFYRIAFKQDMSVMLFRVDIIHLLYNMIKGPEPLDRSSKPFKEWEELVRQILRKCIKKIQERPELLVEMLFSKLRTAVLYLESGFDMQPSTRVAKPDAELEFRHTEDRDRQVAIVVGAMLDRSEGDHVSWLKGILTEAESERRSWAAAQESLPSVEGEEQAMNGELRKPPLIYARPDSQSRRTAMFKNAYLRLLMTVCGLQRLGPASEETPESCWVIADGVSADNLKDSLHYINQAEFSPPTFEDGAAAAKQLKRKTAPRKKTAFDDDGDEGADLDDDELFPAGGPTVRRAVDEAAKANKTRRRRRRRSSVGEPDDAELEEKARKRREREREKARRIKSALYVHEGDDEFDEAEDAAFFARERVIAERAKQAAESAAGRADAAPAPRKRKSDVLLEPSDDGDDDDDDDEDGDGDSDSDAAPRLARRGLRRREDPAGHSETDGAGPGASDDGSEAPRKRRRRTPTGAGMRSASLDRGARRAARDDDVDMDAPSQAAASPRAAAAAATDDDDDDARGAAVALRRRPRVRGGFVLDSSDDGGGDGDRVG